MRIQKETLVPIAFERTNQAVIDLQQTGLFLKGLPTDLPEPHRFNISDLFKVIEGAAYLLKLERDPRLEAHIDEIAAILASAQEDDGYIYPAHTTGTSARGEHWGGSGMGDRRYSWVVHSHELYNMGHLYEAAVAYYQATGKRNLLDISIKNARHVNEVFFQGGNPKYNNGIPINQAPGHQGPEIALVKMYRVTGEQLFLDMAKRFIDIRGITYIPDGEDVMSPEYAQQHAPVRQQTEAVGHAVRATYLYSGMADVGALTNDKTLNPALLRIWHDIVDTRMHITGGLGAIHGIEGFGAQYQLPNRETYNETCAAVGNVFFNHRMFLLQKDGKYMDVAEISLLNNVLAGVNLQGNKFAYVNPLESAGAFDRSYWFGTACCPTNMARLIPQVSGLMYAQTDNQVYCSFYASNKVQINLKSGNVELIQHSNYPFDERVTVIVFPQKENQRFGINMRIPTWASSQFVPGNLYHYIDGKLPEWKVFINGEEQKNPKIEKGFVRLDRRWKKDDKIELLLPMPVRYNAAIEEVKENNGRISITRGPLVYCAEGVDNEGRAYLYYIQDMDNNPTVERINDGLLSGIDAITGIKASYLSASGNSHVSDLTLVPYYAWNNRGISTMNVWFATDSEIIKHNLNPITVELKDIRVSHTYTRDNIMAVVSGNNPRHSFDTSIERWTSWNKVGEPQWIEFIFDRPTNLRSFSVYWYNDRGGVQPPTSWNLEYLDSDRQWKPFPLYSTDSYNLLENQYNLVHSSGNSFVIDALRLNMTARPNSAVGILQTRFDVVN
jgi:DUF1680 family protein